MVAVVSVDVASPDLDEINMVAAVRAAGCRVEAHRGMSPKWWRWRAAGDFHRRARLPY